MKAPDSTPKASEALPGEKPWETSQRLYHERRKREERAARAAKLRRRIAEGDGRYVFVERVRCPECKSLDLEKYRTTRDGEVIYHHTRCNGCKANGRKTTFIAVNE